MNFDVDLVSVFFFFSLTLYLQILFPCYSFYHCSWYSFLFTVTHISLKPVFSSHWNNNHVVLCSVSLCLLYVPTYNIDPWFVLLTNIKDTWHILLILNLLFKETFCADLPPSWNTSAVIPEKQYEDFTYYIYNITYLNLHLRINWNFSSWKKPPKNSKLSIQWWSMVPDNSNQSLWGSMYYEYKMWRKPALGKEAGHERSWF